MNHASRDFWLVPVLPAEGQAKAALRAVPASTVPVIIAFIMPTISERTTRGLAPPVNSYSTSPSVVVMRLTKCTCGR